MNIDMSVYKSLFLAQLKKIKVSDKLNLIDILKIPRVYKFI